MMDQISAPILPGDRGPAVRTLQQGLLLLLGAGQLEPDEGVVSALTDRLGAEQRDEVFSDATGKAVTSFQQARAEGLDLPGEHLGVVDEPTAASLNAALDRLVAFSDASLANNGSLSWLIAGRVEYEDGSPTPGVLVAAYDRELGTARTRLGDPADVLTADDGSFTTIRYEPADVTPGEGHRGPTADLVFEVSSPDAPGPLLVAQIYRSLTGAAESRVPEVELGFAATPSETVRIVVSGGSGPDTPEYDRLQVALEPLLHNGATTPADLDQNTSRDVDFAARETGWDGELIETMRQAWALASALNDGAPNDGALNDGAQSLAETCYGLLRTGPPTDVSALPADPTGLLQRHDAWAAKLADSLAHDIIGGRLDEHMGRLRTLRAETTLPSAEDRRSTAADVLFAAGVTEDQQRRLLDAYVSHTGPIEDFWTRLVPQQLQLSAEEVASVQDGLQLADLVGYDPDLISALHENGFRAGRDLVRLSRADWLALVSRIGPRDVAQGGSVEERLATTVNSIVGMVESTFPTEVVHQLVLTTTHPGISAARDLLARFFDREASLDAGFDITTSPATSYLEENAERVFLGLGEQERQLLTGELQRLQRVVRLGVDRERSEVLLDLGLDSAFHITRFSPEQFVAEYGSQLGGADSAVTTYQRAEGIAGTVLYLFTELWQGTQGTYPSAMKMADTPQIDALKELPAYRALFGSLQLCECEHCRSFFSPAAYFVDVLHMLDRPSLGAGNPVEALFARRPDLAHIQLTCDNTNTLIPYVDLVLEVLESFVAHRAPVPFNEPPPPPDTALPSPTAEELQVNPVHLTAASKADADQAAAILQEAVFPLNLPLNLPLETTRAYLQHLGTTRAELMHQLDLDPGLEAVLAQAAEILCLSPEEFELLTGSTFGGASSTRPATAAEFFGLSVADTPTDNARTLYNHAAPEFARVPAAPDRREPLIASVQNALEVLGGVSVPVTRIYDVATEAAVNALLVGKGLAPSGRTDATFWGALEGDHVSSLSVLLCPVPMLLDRAGLTFPELVALVGTRFLNPAMQGQGDLDLLARLDIPASDVRNWIISGLAAVPAGIAARLAVAGADPATFTRWVQERTKAVVLNSAFEAPCDLDQTTLLHLDGTLLSADELLTIFRFVRLWRRLGWTLSEVDLVVEPGGLQGAAAMSTVLLLANALQLRSRLGAPMADVVTLWQPIPTFGPEPLYDKLFRNRAAQLVDPVLALDDARAELAAAGSATAPALTDHALSVMAALGLSAEQFATVRVATGLADDPDPTANPAARPKLTRASLSSIYRRVALARSLGLAVEDLITLLSLSALDVFERPDRFPRMDAVDFVDLVETVRASGVPVAELEYLCRGVPRPPGLPGNERASWQRTLAELLDGLHAIASDEPDGDDPSGELLTAQLTGLLGPADATAVSDLVYGRDTYRAPLTGLPTGFTFAAGLAARVSWDRAGGQMLFRGAPTAADKAGLLATPGVPAAVQVAFATAVELIDTQPRALVARVLSAMMSPAMATAALIDVSSLDAAGRPVTAVIDHKAQLLKQRRRVVLSQGLIKQILTTATQLPADAVALLLENTSVLTSLDGSGAALSDYEVLDGTGLAADYFVGIKPIGSPVLVRTDPALSFDWRGLSPGPGVPAVAFSARWTGSVYVPAAGAVTLRVSCSDGIRVLVDNALVIDEWRDQPKGDFSATLRLDGAQFYPIEVEYYNQTGAARLQLTWSSPSIPTAVVPQRALYTAERLRTLLRGVERIYKLDRLLRPFAFSAHELQALSTHGDMSLDVVPLDGSVSDAVAEAIFGQWRSWCAAAALRDRYPSTDAAFVDVLIAATPEEALTRFATLTGAASPTLEAVVDALTVPVFDPVTSIWADVTPDLTTLNTWTRIAAVLSLIRDTGAAPAQLSAWARTRDIDQLPTGAKTRWFRWTATDEVGTDRGPDARLLAQESKDTVRARYDDAGWRSAAADLNDTLRVRRRSALGSYVLAMPEMMRANVTDSGSLFEFFLLETEMDACADTSRIKQGISSAQLYVDRIMLDLESPKVPPQRVDRARWEWTKNYRVWEANRRIWAYAHNYVTSQFRDDKTPIFNELESELLQDDLTDANAERALRHYLEKLDDVAKLTICGSCVDSATSTLHVFGRSATLPYAFYHRRLDGRAGLSWATGVWTPWQRLPVDVSAVMDGDNSGVHLQPLVWNRRLYLFWLVFTSAPDASNANLPQGFDRVDCWHVGLAWSEYKDGRWSAKQTAAPFLVSPAWTEEEHTVIQNRRSFAPGKQHWTSVTTLETPFGDVVLDRGSGDTITPVLITDDPLLNGTKLENDGDWALHDHHERIDVHRSLLPPPRDHFLEVQLSGDALLLTVSRRFRGTAAGQGRTTTKDIVAVVREGRRTDRTEQAQDDFSSVGAPGRRHQRVGSFDFPACRADVSATNGLSTVDYNAFPRPQDTVNSYLAVRPDWLRVDGLRLSDGAGPILKSVPNRFEVFDSDGRAGFSRLSPFFYSDQRRSYLVTREAFARRVDERVLVLSPPKYAQELHLDSKVWPIQRAVEVHALAERQLGIAASAPLVTNPWAAAALQSWSNGPGVPTALLATPSTMELSVPKSAVLTPLRQLDLSSSVADLWDFTQSARAEYVFTPHWHPYTCNFLAALNGGGLPGLYTLDQQLRSDEPGLTLSGQKTKSKFDSSYRPDPAQVASPWPLEEVDFSRHGSYSIYNWEIFFHIPMLAGTQLTAAGRYDEALRWFARVFDPTTADTSVDNRRFWRFLPFRSADTSRIEDLVATLSYTGADPVRLGQREEVRAGVAEWIANPFKPDVIARRRPAEYMKFAFLRCLDAFIGKADALFRRGTLESNNEATQYYVLASHLLGPMARRVPDPGPVQPQTYQSLRGRLDELSNAQVDLETRLPFTQLFAPPAGAVGTLSNLPQTLYFCIPPDEQLLAYWDTIADRLFKLRHCMDIDGNVRQLPLFEPRIDPMLLVEATAKGMDIGSVLNDLYAPLPRQRFTTTLARAMRLCEEVRSLGSTLLNLVQQHDGERLSALRAQHETLLLDQMRETRRIQIDEAEQTRQGLEIAGQQATARRQFYDNLLSQGLIPEEAEQLKALDTSNQRQETASWLEAAAQLLNLIPNVSVGTGVSVSFGGSNIGSAASAVARSYSYLAGSYAFKANRASITGAQSRRTEQWRFDRDQARRDETQVTRQEAAARIRRDIAQAELTTHEAQIEHARSVEELLRTKFTNDATFGWLESNVRTVYFQAYQAAYQASVLAQQCARHELGNEVDIIKFGAWDSSVRGLLAGERLHRQLEQLERAYLDGPNGFEITKHISLAQLDPIALIALKETGSCEFAIPEWVFDLDYPGHFQRRLKTVSLTIPAVVGPYTSVSATLTLLSSRVRFSGRVQGGTYEDDDNYRQDHLPVQAIAASTGQQDTGRFELSLRDGPYAPFEGAGLDSRWRLAFPRTFRTWNYDSATDIVLRLQFVSQYDETLTAPALAALSARLADAPTGQLRLFSLRHEFPTEWARLLGDANHATTITINKDRFPQLVQGAAVTVVELHSAIILKEPRPAVKYVATLTVGGGSPIVFEWPGGPGRYRSAAKQASIVVPADPAAGKWQLHVTGSASQADLVQIKDILMVARYTAKF